MSDGRVPLGFWAAKLSETIYVFILHMMIFFQYKDKQKLSSLTHRTNPHKHKLRVHGSQLYRINHQKVVVFDIMRPRSRSMLWVNSKCCLELITRVGTHILCIFFFQRNRICVYVSFQGFEGLTVRYGRFMDWNFVKNSSQIDRCQFWERSGT